MICWVDVEADGLDPSGHLLEVALVVTDDDLNEVSYIDVIINPVGIDLEEMIAKCDPIVQKMHADNGLFAELRAGGGLRRHEAESMLIEHLIQPNGKLAGVVELDYCLNCKKKVEEHRVDELYDILECPERSTMWVRKSIPLASQTPLAGSTVGFDRKWLREHTPKLEALFSYRSVDVSSLTELAKRWAPAVYEARPKAGAAHRALADVRESISYLRFFRARGFVGGGNFA